LRCSSALSRWARRFRSALEAMRGNFASGRAHVRSAQEIYEDLGLTTAAVENCGRALAFVEMLADAPAVAEESLRRCCELLEREGHLQVLATRAAELADVLYVQGRHEESEVWAIKARTASGDDDLDAALARHPVEAKLLAVQGFHAEAEARCRAAVELAEPSDGLTRKANIQLALAEVLALVGREDEANEAVQMAIEIFERKGNTVAAEQTRRRLQLVRAD
jgi:tetratricopeptide (TPR) repeat protein